LWNSPALFIYFVSRIERNHLSLSAPYASCEKFFSNSSGIKVSAQREHSRIFGDGSVVFVYLATRDKGNNWAEFMRFYPDESVRTPKCESIKDLDEQNFWVWEGWLLGITHDGGKTWMVWEPRDSWSEWRSYNFDLIMDVQFETPNTGIMYLDTEDIGESSMTIQTDDGGKSSK